MKACLLRPLLLLAVSTLCVRTTELRAQEPDIAAYWKALSEAPTLAAAATVAAPVMAEPVDKLIVSGLSRLRKYEFTTDRTDALVALQDLRRAVERAPENAWAHYAYGMALARGSDVRLRPYAQRSSYKPGIYSLAATHGPEELQRALELDPNLDVAALDLAYVALDLTSVQLMLKALPHLEKEEREKDPRALFMRAQIHNRLGNANEALRVIEQAESLGLDRSVAAIERVTSLAIESAPAAEVAAAYFDGVEHLTNAGAERYFAGVVQIARRNEIEAWRNANIEGRKAWLHQFWKMRAASAGVPADRQIAQLYGKLVSAYRIRGMTVIGGRPEEPHPSTLLGRIFPRVKVGDALPTVDVEEGTISRNALVFKPEYKKQLAMAWEVLQFRLSPQGGSRVIGAAQVMPASIGALESSPGHVDANISISLINVASDVSARETARAVFTRPSEGTASPSSLLLGVSVAAPDVPVAGVRVTVENAAGTNGAIGKGFVELMKFNPDSLTMSDIVISPDDGKPSFERGDVHIAIAPGRTFTSTETPTLYYEVYGLHEGDRYATTIALDKVETNAITGAWKAITGGKKAVTLTFEDIAHPSPREFGVQETRKVGLTSVTPGLYRVLVTVTDSAGRKIVRGKVVEVVE